jgi:hypothetical protein
LDDHTADHYRPGKKVTEEVNVSKERMHDEKKMIFQLTQPHADPGPGPELIKRHMEATQYFRKEMSVSLPKRTKQTKHLLCSAAVCQSQARIWHEIP